MSASQSGYLDTSDIDMLRGVFDGIIRENGIPVDSSAYVEAAQTVIHLYLSGAIDKDDLKRAATAARAA
jgi:hypothetical protein